MKSKMKKLVSMVLAMAMVLMMSVTVFAADTCDITINGTTSGVKYTAYKLMDVTTDGTNYSYTVNNTYSSVLLDALSEVKASTTSAVAYLSDSTRTDAEVQAFADAVYEADIASVADAVEDTDYYSVTADDTTATLTVAYGYYLIVEGSAGDDDSVSLVMLDTAGKDGASVTTKESVPEMTKKIKDTNDSTGDSSDWQDSADYDIDDQVPYQLTATMPDKLAYYDTYAITFHDVMDEGLTFDADSVVVSVSGTTVDSSCYTVTESTTDGCTFEIAISNVKALIDESSNTITVAAGTEIVVDYNATLNSKAVIGNSGNWNKAQLEYSNNPYSSGSGDTGTTPWDTVVVFTYSVTINKTNGTTSLTGAEFSLYKYDTSKADWVSVTLSEDSTGTVFTAKGLDDGVYKIVEDKAPEGYNSLEDPIYFTVFAGHVTDLDNATATEEKYPLTSLVYTQVDCDETDGSTSTYSGSDSVTFTIADQTTYTEVNSVLSSIDVVNKSGSILPSTGGIGTTIFYIVGAVLVLGAGVVLVTRRRTRA